MAKERSPKAATRAIAIPELGSPVPKTKRKTNSALRIMAMAVAPSMADEIVSSNRAVLVSTPSLASALATCVFEFPLCFSRSQFQVAPPEQDIFG
jgi:hypothetical protein